MTVLACPDCKLSEYLATVESILGDASCVIRRAANGDVDCVYDGETRMNWDSSTTVGASCSNCRWSYTGEDWSSKLIEHDPRDAER